MKSVFAPQNVYLSKDGKFYEYISTSGKAGGETPGFRFWDVEAKTKITLSVDATRSLFGITD